MITITIDIPGVEQPITLQNLKTILVTGVDAADRTAREIFTTGEARELVTLASGAFADMMREHVPLHTQMAVMRLTLEDMAAPIEATPAPLAKRVRHRSAPPAKS